MESSYASTPATLRPTESWTILLRKWAAFVRSLRFRISIVSVPTMLPDIDCRPRDARFKLQDGTLSLPRDHELVSSLIKLPLRFTSICPHMLARLLTNCFYQNTAEIAAVLRRQ